MTSRSKSLNQAGSLDTLVQSFRRVLEELPDKRAGKNKRYGMEDAALSAFGVFFSQSPSFLAYQRMMEGSKGRSNAQSLFGVHQIPSDNHIRDLLDEVEPQVVFPVFDKVLQVLKQSGQLSSFRSYGDNLLLALDGTEYFGSSRIHCQHCSSRRLKNGTEYYFHAAVTPVMVSPGRSQVIPLPPEFIVPQNGYDKQDCENAAAKRWLLQYGQQYSCLGVVSSTVV